MNFLISSKQFAYQKAGDLKVCLGFQRSAVVCPVKQCWSETLHYNQAPTLVPDTRALNPKIKMFYLQISSRSSSKSSASSIIPPLCAHLLTTKNADYLATNSLFISNPAGTCLTRGMWVPGCEISLERSRVTLNRLKGKIKLFFFFFTVMCVKLKLLGITNPVIFEEKLPLSCHLMLNVLTLRLDHDRFISRLLLRSLSKYITNQGFSSYEQFALCLWVIPSCCCCCQSNL